MPSKEPLFAMAAASFASALAEPKEKHEGVSPSTFALHFDNSNNIVEGSFYNTKFSSSVNASSKLL